MNRTQLFILLITILPMLQSCQRITKEQTIIDRAIEAHGGENFTKAKISFDFRNIHYQILKTPTRFEYSRAFKDSLGNVLDLLNNQGFVRTIDGKEIKLPEDRVKAFSNSVNSVAYFALLPYGLNDEAARKSWVGETELDGYKYDIIYVNFSENGGGEDFEDEFLYWINQETGTMDFMAYTYETEGGGIRFRKAVNPRNINGILLQDYQNFKPESKTTPLEKMEELYKNGNLELLSEIQLENIEVEIVGE